VSGGGWLRVRQITYVESALSGASVTVASALPGGSLVLGIASRVTVTFGGAPAPTGYQLGIVGTADLWLDADDVTAGDQAALGKKGSVTAPIYYKSATDLIITAKTNNFNGTGTIKFTVFFLALQAPTE
jgi:hypothetical protein